MKRHLLTAALVVASTLALGAPAGGYPGDLDPSFGSGGSVTLNPPGGGSVAASSATLQADGKLVITLIGVRNAFAVRRYLSDGSLDDTFGAGGAATAANHGDAEAAAAALQPDGKIVVAGRAVTPDCSPFTYTNCAYPKGDVQTFALARFAADGSLDPGFGSPDHGFSGNSTGTVRTLFDGQGGAANAVVIQPDGKIVAAGTARVGTTDRIAVARYNPDGSPDATFGSEGTATTAVGPISRASSVLLQADGKLVVAGATLEPSGASSAFVLTRYNADGSSDLSFGSSGTVTTTIGALTAASSAVLRPDGKIVAAGFTRPAGSSYNQFALAGYNPDGTLDASFGDHGTVTTAVGTSSEAYALVLQPDGTLVAAGRTWRSGGPARMALVLYAADGSPGTGFGYGGRVIAQATSSAGDAAYGLVLQPDGKLIGAGTSLKRFLGSQGESAATTFDVPSAVRDLAASPGVRAITLSWSAPSTDGGTRITHYAVYRGDELLTRLPPSWLEFTDRGLGNGETHTYAIRPENAVGEGPPAETTATTFALPSAPDGLTATPDVASIQLTWSVPASDGGAPVTSYVLYRDGAVLSSLPASMTSHTDAGLGNGETRSYSVSAVTAVGEGPRTEPLDSTTLDVGSAPRKPKAGPGPRIGDIELRWRAPTSDGGTPVTGYRLYRGTDPAHLLAVADLAADARSHVDHGRQLRTTYYYRVTALNAVGESPTSKQAASKAAKRNMKPRR